MPTSPSALDPAVAILLAELAPPQEAALRAIRASILAADARIEEGIKWNAPSYHLAGDHFATFNLRSRDAIQLILHLGARPRPDAAVREAIGEPDLPLVWRSADRAILAVRSVAEAKTFDKPLRIVIGKWLGHL